MGRQQVSTQVLSCGCYWRLRDNLPPLLKLLTYKRIVKTLHLAVDQATEKAVNQQCLLHILVTSLHV